MVMKLEGLVNVSALEIPGCCKIAPKKCMKKMFLPVVSRLSFTIYSTEKGSTCSDDAELKQLTNNLSIIKTNTIFPPSADQFSTRGAVVDEIGFYRRSYWSTSCQKCTTDTCEHSVGITAPVSSATRLAWPRREHSPRRQHEAFTL